MNTHSKITDPYEKIFGIKVNSSPSPVKHTPKYSVEWHKDECSIINDEAVQYLCIMCADSDESREDVQNRADDLCRAVNSHAAMLEALEGLLREMPSNLNVKKHYSLMVYKAAATKAIALAKVE